MGDSRPADALRPAAGPEWRGAVAVAAVAVAVYAGKAANGLLRFDDYRFIVERPSVRSLRHLPQFFFHDVEGLYRPLREALYTVSYDGLGFGANPLGYQLVGLALHALCCAAFYLLLRRLAVEPLAAGVAAVVFAAHPAHVERVAWVTASYDLLGEAFLLFALVGRAAAPPADGRFVRHDFLWLTALAAALFSSESAAIFPLLALALDYAQTAATGEWRRWPRVKRDLAGLALVAVYFACRFAALGRLDRGRERPAQGFLDNLLAQALADVRYLHMFVAPWKVNFYQVIQTANLSAYGPAWAALAALAAALIFAYVVRRRAPLGALGVFWFFVCLLPTSQILANRNLFQERYAYTAYGGVALLVGLAAAPVWRAAGGPRRRAALAAAGAFCLAALVVLTSDYVSAFHDDMRLWTRVAAREPNSEKALTNLAASYMSVDRFDAAVPILQRALQRKPGFEPALRDLAECFARLGRLPEAAEQRTPAP